MRYRPYQTQCELCLHQCSTGMKAGVCADFDKLPFWAMPVISHTPRKTWVRCTAYEKNTSTAISFESCFIWSGDE